jgi:hypothetical protein
VRPPARARALARAGSTASPSPKSARSPVSQGISARGGTRAPRVPIPCHAPKVSESARIPYKRERLALRIPIASKGSSALRVSRGSTACAWQSNGPGAASLAAAPFGVSWAIARRRANAPRSFPTDSRAFRISPRRPATRLRLAGTESAHWERAPTASDHRPQPQPRGRARQGPGGCSFALARGAAAEGRARSRRRMLLGRPNGRAGVSAVGDDLVLGNSQVVRAH